MDPFNTKEVPLSSYQQIPLTDSHKNIIGSINMVREGNFSLRQLDLIKFIGKEASIALEVAVKIKEKIRFEKIAQIVEKVMENEDEWNSPVRDTKDIFEADSLARSIAKKLV